MVRLIGLELLLKITVRVSRAGITVSVRISVK